MTANAAGLSATAETLRVRTVNGNSFRVHVRAR